MVVCLCPGWVKTGRRHALVLAAFAILTTHLQLHADMGTDDAPLELEESVSSVAKVLTSLKPEDNGRLINYRHEIVPW